MKWLFKIFLALNVFLLCGSNFTGAYPFIHTDTTTPSFLKEPTAPHYSGTHGDVKFNAVTTGDDLSKLLAAEFEDDNVETARVKKQTVKANLADIFSATWSLAGRSHIVKHNLLPGRLPIALALNKVYLAIQVFRL